MSGPEAKAPPLRFMSSLEPWERKRFGEFATLRRGLTYTPADCREKGVRVLRSSNISEETFVLHNDDVFVSEQAANIPFVRNGDILITAANGSSHLVGKHALIDGVGEKDTVHGGFMLLAESDLPEFLDAAMSAPWYKQFVADYMMGGNGALGNLAKSSFDECTFLAPSTQHEQRRIGSLFRSLDALIAGREKALGKLKAVKKSMMLKMFPQGDATVPEVRFKGFAGDWEKKRLGDVTKITMGQSPDGATYAVTPSTYILVQGNADLKDGWVMPRVWTTQKTKEAKAGSLIMSVRAPAGAMGKTQYDIVLGRGVAALSGDEFLYQLLSLHYENGYWRDFSCGSTFESLNSDVINNAEILCPSLPEQQKIGAYFRSLDTLLLARREELGKLKLMKKALLERMFV